jgi:hypothetical protein
MNNEPTRATWPTRALLLLTLATACTQFNKAPTMKPKEVERRTIPGATRADLYAAAVVLLAERDVKTQWRESAAWVLVTDWEDYPRPKDGFVAPVITRWVISATDGQIRVVALCRVKLVDGWQSCSGAPEGVQETTRALADKIAARAEEYVVKTAAVPQPLVPAADTQPRAADDAGSPGPDR